MYLGKLFRMGNSAYTYIISAEYRKDQLLDLT